MGHWPIESSNLSLSASPCFQQFLYRLARPPQVGAKFPRLAAHNHPTLKRHLALGAVVAALALMPSGAAAHAEQAAVPASVHRAAAQASTSSFYVYGSYIDVCVPGATTDCPLYADAASEAVPAGGGMTILDFGAPCFEPATLAWGTQLFNSQSCTPNAALVVLAQAWLRGYETNPNRTNSASYVLVAGTSNSLTAAVPGNALTSDEMSMHGQAWFTSVIAPIAAAAQSLGSRVTTWAGDDIEESRDGNWYDGPTTTAWVDAYASASGASKPCVASRKALMVDYGDYVPGVPGWSPSALYHVAWQAAPACPVPEIYDASNAGEWQSLNGYALGAGLPPVEFTGVLSEDGSAGSLSALSSWQNLAGASGQTPPYLSVIGATGPIPPVVPDQPTVMRAVPGPGLITLTWGAPAWDGGAAVTTYTVSVYDGSTLDQQVAFSGFPAPETAIVAGLAGGTSYTFYVSASNRAGTGPESMPFRSDPMWSPVFP